MSLIGCGIKGQHKNQSSLHTSNKTRTEILKIHTYTHTLFTIAYPKWNEKSTKYVQHLYAENYKTWMLKAMKEI